MRESSSRSPLPTSSCTSAAYVFFSISIVSCCHDPHPPFPRRTGPSSCPSSTTTTTSCSWIPSCTATRSEEHTSELHSLMRISYAVFPLKKYNHTYSTKH